MSISELAANIGFECNVLNVFNKPIRPGGFTEKNMSWINKIYPKYRFPEDCRGFYCEMSVVEFKRIN